MVVSCGGLKCSFFAPILDKGICERRWTCVVDVLEHEASGLVFDKIFDLKVS